MLQPLEGIDFLGQAVLGVQQLVEQQPDFRLVPIRLVQPEFQQSAYAPHVGIDLHEFPDRLGLGHAFRLIAQAEIPGIRAHREAYLFGFLADKIELVLISQAYLYSELWGHRDIL